jgi:lysophospholipid acyltransferase (LPLAT)-like uncharacterized protein
VDVSRESRPWWLPIAARGGEWLVRLLGATWRFDVVRHPDYALAERAQERFVYAFWHSAILPMAVLRRDEGIAVLVSRHRDGELITRVIEGLGYVTARGSSTRGGEAGAREMLSWAERGAHLAVTPDGPRGPRERAKDGVVYLAERSQRRLVPIAIAARSVWVMKSWDGFRIPRPFARVRVAYGAPMTWSEGDVGVARDRFEHELTVLTQETRRAAGEPS